MKKTLLLLFSILILGGFFIGLAILSTNTSQPSVDKNKLQVVASFYPMYFFASQIAGDKAQVYNVTPASAEPHDYEPTTQDVTRIENSSLLILNGGSLEAWGPKVKDTLKNSHVTVITAGEGLFNRTISENGERIQDAHIWLDPQLAKVEVGKITNAFVSIDAKNAAYYYANEKSLDATLDVLDQSYKIGLSSCKQKDIITSHAAFGYLSQRYGLTQVSISGVSPDEEPSIQELVQLTNFVEKNNIHVIFFESLVSPKLSQTIASETGAQTMVLDPIEGIPDAQLLAGENYFTIMKQNLVNLRIALQCSK